MKKKVLLLLSAVTVFLASCQKEEELISPVSNTNDVTEVNGDPLAKTTVPSTFTQKMLMEMFSTTGCATCPDAEYKYDKYALAYPDKVYGVNVHTNDAMAHSQFGFLDGLLNVTQYSSGSFNRIPVNGVTVLHKTTWKTSVVTNCLNKTASCGLMINSTKSGTNASVTVTAGFNKVLSGNYKMTIYVIEDNVVGTGPGYNQANYYNNIATSPFYQMGNPIIGYPHSYVLRKVLTPSLGVSVPATSVVNGGSFSKTYSFSTTGYNSSQLYVVAFINKAGSTPTTQEIMNVQRVKLGFNKAFD
jgi:hypothetical protein